MRPLVPKYVVVALVVTSAVTLPTLSQQPRRAPELASVKQMQFPGAFDPVRTFPTAAHGYLLSFSRHVGPAKAGTVVLHSLHTGEQRTISISVPGIPKSIVEAGAVSLDGKVQLAISQVLPVGGTRGAIIRTDATGRILSVVQLGSYTASHICTAADGSIWTLGQDWDETSNPAAHQRALLRNYTSAGVLKSFHLAGDELPAARLDLRPRGKTYRATVTDARLSCGPASVGAFIAAEGQQFWYEVSMRTGITKRWLIAHKNLEARMTGLALLSERTPFASFASRTGAGMRRGLFQLVLPQDGRARWARVPVSGSEGGEIGPTLLGKQDTALLYMLGSPQARVMNPVVHWIRP